MLRRILFKQSFIVEAQPLSTEMRLSRILTQPRSLLPDMTLRLKACELHPMVDLPHRLYIVSNRSLVCNVCDPLEQTIVSPFSELSKLDGQRSRAQQKLSVTSVVGLMPCRSTSSTNELQKRLSTRYTRSCPGS